MCFFTHDIISPRIEYVHLPCFCRILYCLNHSFHLWGFYLFILGNLHFYVFIKFGFKDVLVIIDCTELFIDVPQGGDARKQTWSEYKHHQTVKFMIGLGPHMGVTCVSKMFTGRASDHHVTRESRDLLHTLRYVSKLGHTICF